MIRPATLVDVEAIAALLMRSWQAGYRGLLPDAYLDGLDAATRAPRWRSVIEQSRFQLMVQDVDGRIAGFICFGPSRDADAAASTGEVLSLHVDPEAWRGGHGRRLMEWAQAEARARDWPLVTLWVFRDNPRARRFYEAVGFMTDGVTHERIFDGMEVAEVRYAWAYALTTPPPSA